MEVKVKSYRVGQRGAKGLAVTIPAWWAQEHDIGPGTQIGFYADERGRLILVPEQERKTA